MNAQRIITYGIHLNGTHNWINYNGSGVPVGFSKEPGLNLNFGITGNYYLNKFNAISTGINAFNFKLSWRGTSYGVRFPDMDSENKNYERLVNGSDISENTSILALQVPITFVHEFVVNRNLRIFASLGPAITFPFSGQSKVSGTFTYKGYYSDGNFTLEDIPLYGFSSDVIIDRSEKPDFAFLSVQVLVSTGCLININRYWRFSVHAGFCRSLTSPLKNADNYYISDKINEFNSILRNRSTSMNTLSLGVGIQKVILY